MAPPCVIGVDGAVGFSLDDGKAWLPPGGTLLNAPTEAAPWGAAAVFDKLPLRSPINHPS